MTDLRAPGNLTTTELALLGMLARYGEHSGYELLKLAEGGIGYFWSPARSHVYDLLPRLERDGCARRRHVAQRGRPDKQLWRITARGRSELRAWLDSLEPDPFESRGLFLLKLFFGDHGSAELLLARVERFAEQADERLKALQEIERQGPPTAWEELPWMTLGQGLASAAAHLRWAQSILPALRARASAPSRAQA